MIGPLWLELQQQAGAAIEHGIGHRWYALIFSPDGYVHEISLDTHYQFPQIWLMQIDTPRQEPESAVKVLYGLRSVQ